MKTRLSHFVLLPLLFSITVQLNSQFVNKNDYINLNKPDSPYSLYTQYSPIEKGWVIFKRDFTNQNYLRQQYIDKSSNKKISLFKNLYVGDGDEILTNDGKDFKEISPYSDTIDNSYKSIYLFGNFIRDSYAYNTPYNVLKYRHVVGKNINGTYCSVTDMGMDCDTFEFVNGHFIPLFFKDHPNFSENIYRKNGYIVPPLFYVEPAYFYSIKKSENRYELSDLGISFTDQAFFIDSYDSLDCADGQYQSRKTFPANVKLSYGNSESFLIAIDKKWYLCQLPKNMEILRKYLIDKNEILSSDKSLYSYFGNLDATSIKILNWDSNKPVYFIARVKGIDYLYDYRQAEVKNIEKNINFLTSTGISGEIIKPYYVEKEKPYCIEVRHNSSVDYYLFQENRFTKINYNPFECDFKAIFDKSSYKKLSNDILSKVVEEKTYKYEVNLAEIEAEQKRQKAEEELQRQQQLQLRTDTLKTELLWSQIYHFHENQFNDLNTYFYNFPMKYYNGEQIFYRISVDANGNETDLDLSLVNNTGKILNLKSGEGIYMLAELAKWETPIYAIGESNRTESFFFIKEFVIPKISSSDFQCIGYGPSSYNRKDYLITKTYKTGISGDSAISKFISAQILSYKDVFSEAPDINDIKNVEFKYYSRLSNNNILLVLKADIAFLSGQLNKMFGIDGPGNFSRTFSSSTYYKFLIISDDGSKIVSNKNYLIPIKFLRPIDGGFVIMTKNLADAISLNKDDFGRKSTIYSNEAGKEIIVTKGVSFSENYNYEEGVKIIKFDNNANILKEIIIDNPTDKNILKPIPDFLQASENFLCVSYISFDQNVVNEQAFVFEKYDFSLNLKSKYIQKVNLNLRERNKVYFPVNAMNDIFTIVSGGERYEISFDK